jgi:hypothetical protein
MTIQGAVLPCAEPWHEEKRKDRREWGIVRMGDSREMGNRENGGFVALIAKASVFLVGPCGPRLVLPTGTPRKAPK